MKNHSREKRILFGLTVAKLSELSGVSVSSINRGESGKILTERIWNNIINGLNKGRDKELFPNPVTKVDIFDIKEE